MTECTHTHFLHLPLFFATSSAAQSHTARSRRYMTYERCTKHTQKKNTDGGTHTQAHRHRVYTGTAHTYADTHDTRTTQIHAQTHKHTVDLRTRGGDEGVKNFAD